VDVQDGEGQAATWQIVGEDEADIKEGRISVSSPIARALIGKEAGESVEVKTPGGLKSYEIIDVRYE
jgi:transcription elongation factor GreA